MKHSLTVIQVNKIGQLNGMNYQESKRRANDAPVEASNDQKGSQSRIQPLDRT